MSRTILLALVMLACAEFVRPPATLAQPMLPEYAVLGLDEVTLGRRARVRSGSVGAIGGTVTLGSMVRVAGTVAADIVVLRGGASAERFFCRLVQGPSGPGVAGPGVQGSPLPSCRAFTPPLVDPNMLPPAQVVPGDAPLRVAPHTGTAPLPPGSFADVVVGAGSLLELAGGSYAARSITIARGGRIVCTGGCTISVLGTVSLRRFAQLGAATSVGADKVRINIAGQAPLLALRTRRQVTVAATIYAPAGDIVLGPAGRYRGAYIGRSVRVGARADVRADSAL